MCADNISSPAVCVGALHVCWKHTYTVYTDRQELLQGECGNIQYDVFIKGISQVSASISSSVIIHLHFVFGVFSVRLHKVCYITTRMSEGVLTKGRCAIALCSYLKSIINMWFRKDIKFKYYFFILISNWNYKCSPRSSPAMLCMQIQSQTWSYLLHIFVDKMHSYSLLFSMNFFSFNTALYQTSSQTRTP